MEKYNLLNSKKKITIICLHEIIKLKWFLFLHIRVFADVHDESSFGMQAFWKTKGIPFRGMT